MGWIKWVMMGLGVALRAMGKASAFVKEGKEALDSLGPLFVEIRDSLHDGLTQAEVDEIKLKLDKVQKEVGDLLSLVYEVYFGKQ